jgi:hypothetical protein
LGDDQGELSKGTVLFWRVLLLLVLLRGAFLCISYMWDVDECEFSHLPRRAI